MVGAITSGQISEYIGRKGSLMIAAIPNIIGWLAISFARVPVYIAEIAPQNMRGAMGSVNQESCYHIFWHYLLNGGCLQFLIGIGLLVLQQLSGINGVIFCSNNIFESAGVGIIQVIATAVATWLVDKTGRRILLIGANSARLST